MGGRPPVVASANDSTRVLKSLQTWVLCHSQQFATEKDHREPRTRQEEGYSPGPQECFRTATGTGRRRRNGRIGGRRRKPEEQKEISSEKRDDYHNDDDDLDVRR